MAEIAKAAEQLAQLATEEAARQQLARAVDYPREWHVVHTLARLERLAYAHLRRAGYEIYTPQTRETRKPKRSALSHNQRKHINLMETQVIRPLFPRYSFVRFNSERDPWHDIFKMAGIHGMFCNGGLPVPVRDGLIDGLKASEVNGAIPAQKPVVELLYRIGERVRVSDGPFKYFTAQIARIGDDDRITLLVHLLGKEMPFEFTAEQIEKTAERSHTLATGMAAHGEKGKARR
jgi:transcription antitermination factor NusG